MAFDQRFRGVCIWVLVAFLAVCALVGYWSGVRGDELRANPENPSAVQRMARTCPGRLDAGQQEILGREQRGETWVRTYPGGEDFCHLTGYGPASGLQKPLRAQLYATGGPHRRWKELLGDSPVGNDVHLAIMPEAQQVATRLLRQEGKPGAVVAVDPRSGALLVMASAPAYSPEGLTTDPLRLEQFQTNPDTPELNRALQGMYPPGSVFKLAAAAGALEAGFDPETKFVCHGRDKVQGIEVACWQQRGHGELDLAQAVERSCNVYFAHVGAKLGGRRLSEYATSLGVFEPFAVGLPTKASAIPRRSAGDVADAMAMAYGQGKLMVTPLAMALLGAVIANGGQLQLPYLVASAADADGGQLAGPQSGRPRQVMDSRAAEQLRGMMRGAVEHRGGTAGRAASSRTTVAGKTGSAQHPDGPAHAWFVGFAPAEEPQAAVAVIVERGGSGGDTAAPIAREVLGALLD